MRFITGMLVGGMVTLGGIYATHEEPTCPPAKVIRVEVPVATTPGTMEQGEEPVLLSDLAPDNSGEYEIQSGRGPDGYRLDKAEFDHETINLTVYKYRDEKSFRAAMRAAGQDPKITLGLAYFSAGDNECTILVRDPAYRYQPTTLGHELTHCIYGDFHDSDDPE